MKGRPGIQPVWHSPIGARSSQLGEASPGVSELPGSIVTGREGSTSFFVPLGLGGVPSRWLPVFFLKWQADAWAEGWRGGRTGKVRDTRVAR